MIHAGACCKGPCAASAAGKKVPEKAVQKLLRTLYGDTAVRERALLASPEVLVAQEAGGFESTLLVCLTAYIADVFESTLLVC